MCLLGDLHGMEGVHFGLKKKKVHVTWKYGGTDCRFTVHQSEENSYVNYLLDGKNILTFLSFIKWEIIDAI